MSNPLWGGANIIDKIKCNKKIGCDNQDYLIELFKNIDKLDELPEEVTREHYNDVRECYRENTDKYPKWYVSAIGFLASFNGRFFEAGYGVFSVDKTGRERNHYLQRKNNLKNQSVNLKDIEWIIGDYRETCSSLKDCLIYCDPPYKDKQGYASSKNFNHDEFWEWCRRMSESNIVIISETQAPSDFEKIWEKEVNLPLSQKKNAKMTEKLFKFRG